MCEDEWHFKSYEDAWAFVAAEAQLIAAQAAAATRGPSRYPEALDLLAKLEKLHPRPAGKGWVHRPDKRGFSCGSKNCSLEDFKTYEAARAFVVAEEQIIAAESAMRNMLSFPTGPDTH